MTNDRPTRPWPPEPPRDTPMAPPDPAAVAELEQQFGAAQQAADARYQKLLRRAQTLAVTHDAWRSISTEAELEQAVAAAQDDYATGSFLLRWLGAAGVLDPALAAILLAMREGLIDEFGVTGTAGLMLVDLTVLDYANALRVQGWIGNTALLTEAELFGQAGPTAKIERRHELVHVVGLSAEERVERMAQQLMPLLDRCNRMLIRNLRALRELKGAMPNLTVANYGQLNVAHAQANTASTPVERPDGPARSGPGMRGRRRRRPD